MYRASKAAAVVLIQVQRRVEAQLPAHVLRIAGGCAWLQPRLNAQAPTTGRGGEEGGSASKQHGPIKINTNTRFMLKDATVLNASPPC